MKPRSQIRLLIVEDEQKLATSIQKKLRQLGYDAVVSFDGLDAEKQVRESQFHLVILDLGLPGKPGLDVLRDIRASGIKTPVLILSARESPKDRILGLELGADDYMVKPFDSGELVARIESILRRIGTADTTTLKAGDLVVDTARRAVTRGGKKIALSGREYSLLEFFLRNKNQILTRKRLVEQVWGYPFETGTNIVDVYVSYLREAIDKDHSVKLIRTIHGEGFILMEPDGSPLAGEQSEPKSS